MMHREVVARRKVPVIAILLLVTTVVLYLPEGIELIGWDDDVIGETLNTIILIFAAAIILKEIMGCSLSYKYAIVSDKLIVNKIKFKNEDNLESIKISDILYIGKKSEIPRIYSAIKNKKNYLCNIIGYETYYCIYKSGENISKFSFQPSNIFIQRIVKHSCIDNINICCINSINK